VRWAARVASIAGTVCIIANEGVIATFAEPIFCAAAKGACEVGAHGGVVQITLRKLICCHVLGCYGPAPLLVIARRQRPQLWVWATVK